MSSGRRWVFRWRLKSGIRPFVCVQLHAIQVSCVLFRAAASAVRTAAGEIACTFREGGAWRARFVGRCPMGLVSDRCSGFLGCAEDAVDERLRLWGLSAGDGTYSSSLTSPSLSESTSYSPSAEDATDSERRVKRCSGGLTVMKGGGEGDALSLNLTCVERSTPVLATGEL